MCYEVLRCYIMGDEVQLRITFKGKMAKEFKAVKAHLGVENNTEVVRHLLKEEFDELPPDAKEGIE